MQRNWPRLAIALFVSALSPPPSVRADESRYNFHLEAGPLFNLEQPAYDNKTLLVTQAGVHLRATFEYQFSERVGLDVGFEPDLLFAQFEGGISAQQRVVAGARVRPWFNPEGGFLSPGHGDRKFRALDVLSDAWVDAHANLAIGNGTRVGYDVGIGARVPVVAPFQFGVYVRFSQLFAVDGSFDAPTFKQLSAGLTFSIGFGSLHPPPDTDRDGVPDSADHCPDSPRGTLVNEVGCPMAKEQSPPPRCSDTDLDGVCDGSDNCPDTPLDTKVDKYGCPAAAPLSPVDEAVP